jgi:hypothetical protein
MKMLQVVKLPFSFRDGWNEVSVVHPSVWKTLLFIVAPCSLIAPLMLLYAGEHHGASYLIDAGPARWRMVAELFLLAELLTVPLMGVVIQTRAHKRGSALAFKDAFLLAALSAVPMWLSALALASPELWIVAGALLFGLFVAANTLYHGSFRILKMSDPLEAQELSYQVFSVGALAWVMLCSLVAIPLIA